MIITHNMSALNAQRQFGINTNNKAKTAEKLSSGYRINRASDDAAGLSISEKMRRQIRGLSQGIENTEAGVSLCQVADGALAEVHDMLHRITELSVKSANGTNSLSDRQAIQAEINEILDEIDRIEETTAFNGHKIFQPSGVGSGGSNTSVLEPAVSNIECTGTPTDTSISKYTFDTNASGLLINGQSIAWADVKASNGDTMDSLKPNTYSTTMNGLTFSFTVNDGSTMDSVTKALKEASVNIVQTLGKPIEAVNELIANGSSIYPGASPNNNYIFEMSKDEYFGLIGSNYQLIADDTGITFNGQTIKWTDTVSPYYSNSPDGYTMKEYIEQGISFCLNFTGKGMPEFAIKLNQNSTLDGVKSALNGATFDIERTGNIICDSSKAYPGYQDFSCHPNIALKNDIWTGLGYNIDELFLDGDSILDASIDISDPSNIKATFSNGTNTVAFDLDNDHQSKIQEIIDNGGTVQAGELLRMRFTYGDSWVEYHISIKQDVDITNLLNQYKNNIESEVKLHYAYTNLKVANFKINDISQGNVGNTPIIYNSNVTQPKPIIKQNESSNNFDSKWNLWIQSGSDTMDGIPLEIDRMNTKILGINDLNVTSIEGAECAMTAVEGALEKLSANRSKIGAQQNRLEHTIRNQENTVENTTASESRIRDADMADLMVKYSKENILEQAGHAMMAQANQSTQGILSILQ